MRLLFEKGGERISFPIEEGETFIGRKDYCDLCFPDPSVSKRHVRLVRRGARVEMHDAGSRNGTMLNGKVLSQPTVLESGDVIQVGKIELEFQADAGANKRSHQVRADRDSMSEEPSDEELDQVRGGRSDSFRDFDDFDASKSNRKEEKRSQRRSRAAVAEVVGEDSDPPREGRRSDQGVVEVEDFPKGASTERRGSKEPAPAGGPRARFTIVEGHDKGRVFEVAETSTFGSKPENAICLKGDGVSRFHAEVTLEGEKWVLKDLGSRNGVFVAGKKVDVHELATGDEVQIGTVRLRFESLAAEKPKAPPLPSDPKELLKDPRVRKVMAALVVAILLIMVVMPSSQPKQQQQGLDDYKVDLAKVVQDLKAEKIEPAKDGAAKLQAKYPGHPAPKLLVEAAAIWEDKSKPLSFRWKDALETFENLKRDASVELGAVGGAKWVEESLDYVRTNYPWWKKVDEATEYAKSAEKARGAGDVPGARDHYLRSLEAFKLVPKTCVFSEHAEGQARRIRTAIFALLRAEGERRMKEARKEEDWAAAQDFLNGSLAHTEDVELIRAIKAEADECTVNMEGEKLYAAALKIIQERKVDEYKHAQEMLAKIDKRARVYVDAQGVYRWIDADQLVRQGRLEYDTGNGERAIELLRKALAIKEIGPEAQATIKQRMERWNQVIEAYKAGRAAYDAEDLARAEKCLREVLKLEPSRENRYNVLANRLLEWIEGKSKEKIDSLLQRGYNALKESPPDYDDAYGCFGAVLRETPQGPSRDKKRAAIERAVEEGNRKGHWFEKAQKDFMSDNVTKLSYNRDCFRLLKDYLPKGHEDKKRADDLFKRCEQRLKTFESQPSQPK